MRRCLTTMVVIAGLLSGCASTGMPSFGGTGAAPSAIAGEHFSFRDARNDDVSVRVRTVVLAGDPTFLPGDPNWIQLELTIENVGSRTLSYEQTQPRLIDGRMLASSAGQDLMKAPSMLTTAATQVGLGTAGVLIGAMLFPPAALIGGMAGGAWTLFNADRQIGRIEELRERSLHTGAIQPNSYVSGLVFIPAGTGIDGISVSYSAAGSSRSIYLGRSDAVPPPLPVKPGVDVPDSERYRIRTTATLRSGPATTSTAVRVLRSPSVVTSTGQTNGEWVEVRDDTGSTGWIYLPLLTPE